MYSKRNQRKQTLNILLCGPSGTGKSSFINTLVGKKVIYENENSQSEEYANVLVFQPTTVEMEEPLEDGSKLVLTLIETEGFGNALKHDGDIEQVATFIENKFDEVLAEESRIRRNPRFKDDRIDACLYFIQAGGHGLSELDLQTMRRLSTIVNVIPVIGRADQLTPNEQALNKRLINEDLKFADIPTFDFQFPDSENGDVSGYEGNDLQLAALLTETSPFSITTSNQFDERGNCLFLRKLSFGTVEILNAKHSDFELLRNALFSSFFVELKDRTHEVLYERYRTHRLDPQQQHRQSLLLPQELADHSAKLKQAQIEREQKMLREREQRVIAEIEAKRAILLKREQELRELEQKMAEQQLQKQQQQLQKQFEDREERLEEEYRQQAKQQHQVGTIPSVQEEERRVKQTQSKRELTAHTEKLHAELGDLEQQKQDIQNRRISTTTDTVMPLNLNRSE